MPWPFVLTILLFLFISQRIMTKELSRFIHRLGGGQKTVIITWSLIFLPGTIVHEISHFLVAALTGARTGKIEIFPEFLEEDESRSKSVTMGYVETQSLNPIQGFLVASAPFISGMALLIWLSSLIFTSVQNETYWILLLEIYLFFTVANSFFPSWSDIRAALPLIAIILITLVASYLLGIYPTIGPQSPIWGIISTFGNALAISVGLNGFTILILLLLNHNFSSHRRKHL